MGLQNFVVLFMVKRAEYIKVTEIHELLCGKFTFRRHSDIYIIAIIITH